MNVRISAALGLAALALAGALTQGCATESYCFADCSSTSGTGQGGIVGVDSGTPPIIIIGNGGSGGDVGVLDGGQGCGTIELCNGQDDNCNGQIDENLDFTNPYQCGMCNHNCRALVQGIPQDQITCTPPDAASLGQVAGVCGFTGKCASDYYDLDKDPKNGCEFYCTSNPTGTTTVDKDNNGKCGVDDDCDGLVDEDLDTTSDPKNCGACGNSCVFVNGAGKCSAGKCSIDKCDTGWWNPPGGDGCWYKCTQTNNGLEICDGIDNDCDNLVDNADPDLLTNETQIGQPCHGGTDGVCADPANAGIYKCVLPTGSPSVAITCCDVDSNNVTSPNPNLPKTGLQNGVCAGTVAPKVIRPGDLPETCNGKDDNCNSQTDELAIDVGAVCGSPEGICSQGVTQCQGGVPVCVGDTTPAVSDPCNGVDDDCDGVIDGTVPAGTPTVCTSNAGCSGGTVCLAKSTGGTKVCATPPAQVGTDCNVPPAAPCVNSAGQNVACGTAGATPVPEPCKKGTFVCAGGGLTCQGAVLKTSTKDLCGEDSNCDGRVDGQPNLLTDVANCGACGNDCNAQGAHVNWTCNNGTCQLAATKCKSGFIDCDANANDCERACTKSGAELCNGFDDDCNCKVDDGLTTTPDPSQVCGVSGTASDPKCAAGNGTTGIKVACSSGKWLCTFPAGYCNQGTPPSCGTTQDVCDSLDNNCNGATDENYKQPVLNTGYLGQPCASDDGKPPPGDGACKATGTFVCNGTSATKCNAVKNAAAAGAELCDGIDNDCDGSVDEPFTAKGTNTTYFVKPAVVQTSGSVWMFQYEASRPNASAVTAGSGNGYWCTGAGCAAGVPAAPAGVTLDKTPACSVPGKVPWFNVTPSEAEEVCSALGGSVCSTTNWTAACTDGAAACKYGYGTGCAGTANYATGPFCNLGPYDSDGVAGAPNTDNVLITKSPLLNQCWASYGATPATTGLFDITGNLREITKRGTDDYPLMGGAFNTDAESGAACDFTFFSVSSTFKLFDTGFRCCFSSNPTQ